MPIGLQVAKLSAKYTLEENVMVEIPGITITGASGRMGQMLLKTVLESDRARLVGAVEQVGHPWVGLDVGEAMAGRANGIIVTDDPLEAFAVSQAVIDFTAPSATADFVRIVGYAIDDEVNGKPVSFAHDVAPVIVTSAIRLIGAILFALSDVKHGKGKENRAYQADRADDSNL